MGKECVAGLVLQFHDAFLGMAGYLNTFDLILTKYFLDQSARIGMDIFQSHHINFVDDQEGGFTGEKWFNGMEKLAVEIANQRCFLRKEQNHLLGPLL